MTVHELFYDFEAPLLETVIVHGECGSLQASDIQEFVGEDVDLVITVKKREANFGPERSAKLVD